MSDKLGIDETTPATQPVAAATPCSPIRFNVNHYVRVRLTEYGRECLMRNHEELAAHYGGKLNFGPRDPEEDAEGWSQWQMHDLMSEFGKHIYCGCKIPFETEIEILAEND